MSGNPSSTPAHQDANTQFIYDYRDCDENDDYRQVGEWAVIKLTVSGRHRALFGHCRQEQRQDCRNSLDDI